MKNNSQLFVITLCLFLFLFPFVKAQTGIYVPSMQTSDNLITQFLNTYQIQGATVAIARNGKLVYMRAFGQYDVGFNAASLASGMYFFKLESGRFTETKKMILLK